MFTTRLYAVREDRDANFATPWRFHTQFVGSVLLWAFRAGATKIDYQPDRAVPFQYTDDQNHSVSSEFEQPPTQIRDWIIQSLFINTMDGHPMLRPIRRFLRRCLGTPMRCALSVPDDEKQVESFWLMTVEQQSATFQLTGTKPYLPRGKRQ